ncbi:MAG TPA: VIT domain-containing protein [Kofleriaceae bacterium]|nr:VIT domain-containing protein [Kofleriaceae bacterium]
MAAPGGEQPVTLEGLDIGVVVTGMFAETTQTLTFRNPNRRPLEGTLTFPLPDGAVVCGYAIDVDGAMVDGVIVPKQEARRILEAEIRKGVDPGLVEHVQGNVYRTRIYPLPAGGTRTIRIVYVSELAIEGNSAAYHLPLAHAGDIERVALRVEITKGEVVPEISGGLGNLSLASFRDSFVAEAKLPRGTACDDLLVRLPDLPRHLRSVETHGEDVFFAVSSAVTAGAATTWVPRRIALLWDASGSRTEVERDLALVSELLELWPRVVIDVRVVRDSVDDGSRTFTGAGERDHLVSYLRELPRDGGTALAALDLDALPHPDVEAWLLFSDGLGTLGRGLPRGKARPVHAISSAAAGDSAYLRQVASQSGGTYVQLVQTTPGAAARLIAESREALRLTGTSGCEDVHVRRAASRLWIVGRLTAPLGQLRLEGSGAPADHISISREQAVPGRLIARAWAGQEAQALAVLEGEAPRILELARTYGVVTPGASLLVLETLEQHLEYEIEPAPSRREMVAQYRQLRERKRADKTAIRSSHLERVVALWRERVQWWETEHRPTPPARKKTIQMRRPPSLGGAPPPASAAPMADMARFSEGAAAAAAELHDDESLAESLAPGVVGASSLRSREMAAPAPAAPSAAAPPPPPRPAAAAPMRGPAAEAPAMEMEQAKKEEEGSAPSPAGSIQIKPWAADTPYLTKIKNSGDPYAAYLRERGEYAASPAFFLDCGDLFMSRGERALGLRVLSNLVELGLDDPPLLRMYAWRLQQAGALTAAITVFERVRRMREDEPQSHRDLALALAERWEATGDAGDATRAMELLYDVIERAWDRFPEIELIALMELNRLIARASARGIAAPARIDRRLIQLLDLDLRISLSWDLDLTDVDLHVFEPLGEHAYYGHNRTDMGGLVSRDFREGYGPEEYVLRKAIPGTYQVKAHYYGSGQQTVAGACTVIAHVFLHYGRPDEQKQVMTLRLDRPSDQVIVGEVKFARTAPAQDDWKARFRKLRRGMTVDEVSQVIGQPVRIAGTNETALVYEPAPGIVVHVKVGPRVTAVQQIMDGAVLDLIP